MDSDTYDVIVIGAGPVGENVADRVVRGGLSAAVVERELVGGECSYWACMPTKALLRSTAALRAARQLPGAREAVTGDLDVAAVLRRRDSFASNWKDDGQVSWLDSAGIALHRGQGRISSDRVVEVTDESGTVTSLTSLTSLTARHAVVVATGSAALLPDIPGLLEAGPWSSREAATARAVPGRLAVIGGGVVASEMATAFAALGSSVTMLARDGVLPLAEPFAGERVTESLREAGVSVLLGAEAGAVKRDGDGTVHITLTTGEDVEADEVLVAIGRTPNTQDIGLGAVGLAPGAWLTVDDTLRVLGDDKAPLAGDWLYAAGDVNRRVLLTHQGKYQAATVSFYPQSPTSVGSVHITGPSLKDPPLIVPGYQSTDHDKELTVAAFTRAREILATEPFASAMTEALPGPEVEDTDDVLRYVLKHGSTARHEVGTCALGVLLTPFEDPDGTAPARTFTTEKEPRT